MITTLLLYGVLGAVAGLLAGLFGVGGGIVIVPMLVFAFGWQQISPEFIMLLALGTSMASIAFTSISSSLAHHQRGAVAWSIVRAVAPGIVVGTFCGAQVAPHLPGAFLKGFFVLFLFYVSVQMFLNKKPKPSRHLPGFVGMTLAGLLIGAVSSLVGIGGGTLSVPFMLWHNVPAHRAVGTSAAIGFPIAVAGGLSYIIGGFGAAGLPPWSFGYVYLPALVGILVVSMLTAPLGARLAHKLPVPKLKRCFACLLLVVAVRMLSSLV